MFAKAEDVSPAADRGVTHVLMRCAKTFSLAGGALFIAMVVVSIASILGRKLWNSPINGDLEILQIGTAIAAAAFFPYCTMRGEHLRVEFFTAALAPRVKSLLDAVANLLLAVLMALLAWRSSLQAIELKDVGEVSMMRDIPIWIAVACLVPSLALTALCAAERCLHHLFAKDRS